jgi:hypothetical protein
MLSTIGVSLGYDTTKELSILLMAASALVIHRTINEELSVMSD